MRDPFEEKLGTVLDAAHPTPALSEGWREKALAKMAADTMRADRKEGRSMRRLTYVTAVLLIIGAAVTGVLTRSRPPDGRALLISAAEAMDSCQSLHLFFTGVESIEEMRPMPGEGEAWLSDRAVSFRYVDLEGELRMYILIDADRLLWRTYDAKKAILYEASLGPAAERLPEILGALNHMIRSGQVASLELADHPEAEVRVERKSRDGRAVDVVTFVYELAAPSDVMVRRAFELDANTGRLLRVQRYVWTEGTPEMLLDSIREIRYDEPMPPHLGVMPAEAANAEILDADVSVEETEKTLTLVMTVDGKEVGRYETLKAD